MVHLKPSESDHNGSKNAPYPHVRTLMLQLTKWSWFRKRHSSEPSETELELYKLEKVINFRWVAHHMGKRSDFILSSKDLVPCSLQEEISQIGQFAEVACGLYDPYLVWRYLEDLSKPDYPFELHDALHDATLLDVLHGHVSNVQAILAYRKMEKQLVVAFSGTFNVAQALHDVNAFRTAYSPCRKSPFGSVKVHAGFWRLYRGVRRVTLESLRDHLQSTSEKPLDVKEIVITGHSLGGAFALLFMMDLLNPSFNSEYFHGEEVIQNGTRLSLVLFGSPRVGNAAFTKLYRSSVDRFQEERDEGSYREYSVKAYNDGVPALPGRGMGYHHAVTSVLFLHHGRLYRTPPSDHECSNFDVIHDEEGYGSSSPPFPLGGHNYYNGRNMEKTVRRMDWITISMKGDLDEGWQDRYTRKVEKEREKIERIHRKNRALQERRGEI